MYCCRRSLVCPLGSFRERLVLVVVPSCGGELSIDRSVHVYVRVGFGLSIYLGVLVYMQFLHHCTADVFVNSYCVWCIFVVDLVFVMSRFSHRFAMEEEIYIREIVIRLSIHDSRFQFFMSTGMGIDLFFLIAHYVTAGVLTLRGGQSIDEYVVLRVSFLFTQV